MLYIIRFVGHSGQPNQYREFKYGITPDLQRAETTSNIRTAQGWLRWAEKFFNNPSWKYERWFTRAEIVEAELKLPVEVSIQGGQS